MIYLVSDPFAAINEINLPGLETVSCQFDRRMVEGHFNENSGANILGIDVPDSLSSAVAKRKAEFVVGRYCAKLAQDKLHVSNREATIGIGAFRQPVWPQGIVGSITHSKGYAAASVGKTADFKGIGIDCEYLIRQSTANRIAGQILTVGELKSANKHNFDNDLHYLTVLFSAKESIYKCLFPLVKKFFSFDAAEITFDPEYPGRFYFEIKYDLDAEFSTGFLHTGYYVISGDRVHTQITL